VQRVAQGGLVEADWAATFWLMNEPSTAQVARKRVTEKRARRVRGAISLDYLAPPAVTANGTVVEYPIVRVNDQIIDNSDYDRAASSCSRRRSRTTPARGD
jgi:hypothetical protein